MADENYTKSRGKTMTREDAPLPKGQNQLSNKIE